MTFKKIMNYLKISALLASARRDDRKSFHGAIGIRGDGAMVKATNGNSPHFTGSKRNPLPQSHCEVRLTKKLDVGSVVFVARVLKSGELANSMPCHNCRRTMERRGVKKCYYSINDSEYGVIDFS